jgi:hypothetical protein
MLCKVIHFSDNKRFCPQLFVAAHHFIHEKEPADDGMLFFLRMNEQHLSAVALWPTSSPPSLTVRRFVRPYNQQTYTWGAPRVYVSFANNQRPDFQSLL